LLGWWGIPWGPIYTIAAVVTNIRGGKDVTAEILQPENTWADKQAFRAKPQDLAERFHKNFEPFAADTPEEVRQAGPKVTVAR
jgi:ATP-dependent phosphoenolpyruvate carboxykinase